MSKGHIREFTERTFQKMEIKAIKYELNILKPTNNLFLLSMIHVLKHLKAMKFPCYS